MTLRLSYRDEVWPLREPFVISRMRQDDAPVGVVEIADGDGRVGRGECDRCEEGVGGRPVVGEAVEAARAAVEAGTDPQDVLPQGPVRNAIDCALWDLRAKQARVAGGAPLWQTLGLSGPPEPVTTVFTIGLGTPEAMGRAAETNSDRPVLKLKLGRPEGDLERVAAVRASAPAARISVDANTGWTREQLIDYLPRLADLGVELVEQPFKPGEDALMDGVERILPVAADESVTDRASLAPLAGRYDFVNLKLDKAGGLTEAFATADVAETMGMRIMVGCNLGTSLAMAPGLYLAQRAAFVDLDGPLLLAEDRSPGLKYEGSLIGPPDPLLWG